MSNKFEKQQTYLERESECQLHFMEDGPFYFICADHRDEIIFTNDAEFKYAINSTAIAVAQSGVKMYVDIIMSNHGHWLVSGKPEQCQLFYDVWRDKVYLMERDRDKQCSKVKWDCKIYPIKDLKMFRNVVAYIARNAYVAMKNETPIGYPWGSADLFFNRHYDNLPKGTPYNDLTYREKRQICRGRSIDLPDNYMVYNGLIVPTSYIERPGVENFFLHANQYFSMLARHAEADIEIGMMTGEKMMLPDDEMFSTVSAWSRQSFGVPIKSLSEVQKFDIAKKMKYACNSDNRQISQILRLSRKAVDRIFPIPV